jgi:rhodanese-related sulfurtransferase
VSFQLPTVTVSDVVATGPALILDVREDDEWAAGHIATALHVPMQSVPSRVAELPTDRRVVVVCKVGGRSAQVTAWLCRQGYDAVNLEGGMIAWDMARQPMVSDLDTEPFVA